ncbi:protein RETICULATA-related [Chloropicon primus]|nr:protein RETICULATA-related [Chloropicon primus]
MRATTTRVQVCEAKGSASVSRGRGLGVAPRGRSTMMLIGERGRSRGVGCRVKNDDGSIYYSEDALDGKAGSEMSSPASTSADGSAQKAGSWEPSEENAGRWDAADKWLGIEDSSGGCNGGGNGGGSGDGSGGGGEGSGGGDEEEEDALLPLNEAEKLAKDAKIPEDWQGLAKLGGGLRQSVLTKYLALLKAGGMVGFLAGKFPILRDRLIQDDRFLFKVATEVLIDSGCATLAEVKKRGPAFWGEFEFYLSDLVVGIFLDVALVTLLAPTCMAGATNIVKVAGKTKGLAKYSQMFLSFQKSLPSAVFEKSVKGLRVYTPQQRITAFLYKGLEYAFVGFACGLVGQSMANTAMIAKRAYKRSKIASQSSDAAGASVAGLSAGEGDFDSEVLDEVPVPPLFRTALVWALFMGVSSNTRYQVVFGLERLVEGTVLAKNVPMIANLATIAIRFANNIYGGEQFIDMARWAGVQ